MNQKHLDNQRIDSILEDRLNSLEYKLKMMEDKISRLEKQKHSPVNGCEQNDQGSRKTE